MEEYTNPAEIEEPVEIDDDNDLFSDYSEPTSEEEKEAEQSEKPAEEKPQAEKADGQKIKLKHLHEEKEYTLEETVALAQKGMDYDRIRADRDTLKASKDKESAVIDHYARMSGMTREAYLDLLDKQRDESIIQAEMASVRAKHPEVGDDLAREIAEIRAEREKVKIEQAEAEKKKAEEEAKNKPWVDFVVRYPEQAKNPPSPEMMAKLQMGLTPIEAMLELEKEQKDKEIAELKDKLEAKEKNQKNKEKAVGSVASTAAKAPVDDFILGLNG